MTTTSVAAKSGRSKLSACKLGVSLSVALWISACGFHLQGRTPLPESMRTPYVEASDRQSEFVQSLQRSLLISGAHPSRQKDTASAVVNILRDQVSRRVLSVSASNQPTEYEVTYTVRFSVVAGHKELLPPQEVADTRTYSFDERLLLAKRHEETILRQDMARDLADIVMRRLARL